MDGPDALPGGQRGGRSALPGAGTETAASAVTTAGGAADAASRPDSRARPGEAGPGGSATRGARPGEAGPGGSGTRGGTRPAAISLSNWPVSARLVAVFAVASVTGLLFGGLRVADAVGDAHTYDRTVQLAVLADQDTALAQALENERDVYTGVAAYNALAAGAAADKAGKAVTGPINAALARQNADLAAAEQVTNVQAQQTKTLASAIGPAFPSSVQSKASDVVTMIGVIPGLRSSLTGQPASAVIQDYSNSIADLFVLDDEITSQSGNADLGDDVRALGALSRAKDEASQQRAFLYAALLESSVADAGAGKASKTDPGGAPYNDTGAQGMADAGGLSMLTTAQGLQFADLTDFDDAATPAQINAFLATVAGPQDDDVQLIESFVSETGNPMLTFEPVGTGSSLGFDRATVAATWYSDASAVVSQMRSIETQLVTTIVALSQSLQHQAVESAVLTAAVTAAAVLLVAIATALVGRSLVNPLRRLQTDALEIAAVRLPARVAAAAAGTGTETAAGPATVEPIGVRSTDEIGRVARAFDRVHAEAVRLAGAEAQLRGSLNAMFISLSRRSVPLIERLARMIDSMEQNEDDPEQLANLFAMDHLVTRMRRNSENLLVLAGEEPVRKWTKSVPLADVTRAAAAEIEQYGRVTLTVQAGMVISGQAAADVVHLLAELIENATLFSPQNTQVRVAVTELRTGGVLIEVRDDGVGITASRLADMNWRLDHPPVLDESVSRHMGLYAVSRLAARHGIRVKLRPGTPQGLSALVWLPGTLTRHEPSLAGGSHSRPAGAARPEPASFRQAASVRHSIGRHRSGLISAGEPPRIAGRADQPARQATAWFAAKRPSASAARSPEDLAAGWQAAASGWQAAAWPAAASGWQAAGPRAASDGSQADGLDGVPEQARRTAAGLPRRVPGTSAYPGSDAPDFGMPDSGRPDFVLPAAAVSETPVLGAPPPGADVPLGAGVPPRAAAPPGGPYQGMAYQEQGPPGRRSPEAARSRLSGFQLGRRDADAVQTGPGPAQVRHTGEGNNR